jgi:VIT1/CCC1 family predicted Fe2+/Mn2+ transporter
MNNSSKKGFSFGLTSGVITTLGLIVGLHSSTGSTLAVIGGIITIAIADAMSDALGIHISEEAEGQHTEKEIWEATIMTFITKFFFASLFIIPFLFFSLGGAIIASITWGLFLIISMSFVVAKNQGNGWLGVVSEHLFITLAVIIITHYVGDLVKNLI